MARRKTFPPPTDPRGQFDERYIPEPNSGCWLWTGQTSAVIIDGKSYGEYGRIHIRGKTYPAHRFALEIYSADEGKGMSACHRCNNKLCVNPEHLYWATHQQNIQHAHNQGLIKQFRLTSHCKNGHELTPENTWVFVQKRCRICLRSNAIRTRTRKRQLVCEGVAA